MLSLLKISSIKAENVSTILISQNTTYVINAVQVVNNMARQKKLRSEDLLHITLLKLGETILILRLSTKRRGREYYAIARIK